MLLSRLRADLDLGNTLLRKLIEAVRNAEDQSFEFAAFDKTLRSAHPEQVGQWESMITAWDADNTKPCPYINEQDGKP